MQAQDITDEMVAAYQRDGMIKVPGIISKAEAAEYHDAVLNALERFRGSEHSDTPIFTQQVNLWHRDVSIRPLTFHPNVGACAERLAGTALRLWHDHALVKQPTSNTRTEFHQDQPYWPHQNSYQSLSCWIALCDVPAEKGCMTFIPGSHRRTDLQAQHLNDARSLFSLAPELEWQPRVTCPLQAGDCTFHHSRCAHMANGNTTSDPRVAHVILFMDSTTTYHNKNHVVTDPLSFNEGDTLAGEMFPEVKSYAHADAALST